MGATNPNREAIEEFCRTHAGFMCHVQTGRMAELMAAADLSVGAGGAATWERCALGLPAIVLAVADNQKPACEAMASQGRTLYLGDCGEVSEAALARVLAGVMETPQWLRLLGERSAELVDGQGLSRLGAAFFAPRLILRRPSPFSPATAVARSRSATPTISRWRWSSITEGLRTPRRQRSSVTMSTST